MLAGRSPSFVCCEVEGVLWNLVLGSSELRLHLPHRPATASAETKEIVDRSMKILRCYTYIGKSCFKFFDSTSHNISRVFAHCSKHSKILSKDVPLHETCLGFLVLLDNPLQRPLKSFDVFDRQPERIWFIQRRVDGQVSNLEHSCGWMTISFVVVFSTRTSLSFSKVNTTPCTRYVCMSESCFHRTGFQTCVTKVQMNRTQLCSFKKPYLRVAHLTQTSSRVAELSK